MHSNGRLAFLFDDHIDPGPNSFGPARCVDDVRHPDTRDDLFVLGIIGEVHDFI